MQSVFRFRFEALSLAVAGVFAGAGALAADEDLFFSELPVVASVSRLPQRLADAPTSVTVIDREMIKASGARDLTDVFRLVPGFQTYPNNTDSARVTYHGLTDEEFSPRVQVLVDGRSMHSPLFRSGVNWATVPVALEDIERIEVVRGTNAVSYGSNAFLGVINIITVDPSLSRGASVSTNHGSRGVRDYTVRAGAKLGDAGAFRFTYQQKDDNGLTNQYDWVDSFRSRLFDLRADFSLSDRDELQVSAGHVEAVMPIGRLLKKKDPVTKKEYATTESSADWPIHDFSQSNTYLQLLWRHTLSADSDLQLRYSYIEDWASDRYIAKLRGKQKPYNKTDYYFEIDEFGDKANRHEIELQHNFSPVDLLRVVWGASWRSDKARSELGFGSTSPVGRDVGRLFGNAEWKPFEFFTGNLGLAVEKDSMAGTHTSPRISGSFHLTPQNTVRIGYSRAYRTASTFDLRADATLVPYARADGKAFKAGEVALASIPAYVGNPELPAERMDTWEIGYLGDWRDWRMSLDARLFREKIPNRHLQVFAAPDYIAEIQDVRIQGVEYQWKWQPFLGTRLMLSQSFIDIDSQFRDADKNAAFAGEPAYESTNVHDLTTRSAPGYSTSAMLMQKLPLGFEFSVSGFWLDKMKWTRNSWQEKYTRVDARLGYPFRFSNWGGEVAYVAQSINGAHGEFKYSGLAADRIVEPRHWISLRLDF